jgi:hypothetical protein
MMGELAKEGLHRAYLQAQIVQRDTERTLQEALARHLWQRGELVDVSSI